MTSMPDMTAREYARNRDVSHVAVLKAIKEGKITRTKAGKINPKKADAEWAANRSPIRKSKMAAAARASHRRTDPEDRPEPGYNEARTKREYLKLERDRLDLLKFKGTLVDATEVEVAAFNQSRAERDALQNWPARVVPIMAAELHCDEGLLFTVMEREVRAFLAERIEGPLLKRG